MCGLATRMCVHAHVLLLMDVNVSLIYMSIDIKVLASYTAAASIAYIHFLSHSYSQRNKGHNSSACKIIKIIMQNLANEFSEKDKNVLLNKLHGICYTILCYL